MFSCFQICFAEATRSVPVSAGLGCYSGHLVHLTSDSEDANPAQVCDIFNDYFINMTKDIGGHDIHGTADDETS